MGMRVARVMGMGVINRAGRGMRLAVGMTSATGIGPGLGLEGAKLDLHRQSQAPQHGIQHRVVGVT